MDDSKAASSSKVKQQDPSSDEEDHDQSTTTSTMATALVATPLVPPNTNIVVGVGKRYRPAPAKTFQCRGYGDCRMVFSRSEHLARHIRKHTGERPFTCHCSKQFSRLDNLRQHAQTVHADKQDQNERMMRDLTSLHASMAAANKVGQNRGKRTQTANQATATAAASASSSIIQHDPIKEEEEFVPPLHYRPGTSTGYEGTDTLMYTDSWSTDAGWTSSHPRPPNNHSFRDSSQSFRVPPASSASTFYHQHQSFLPISSGNTTFSFAVPPSRDASRPPTAGATSTSSTAEPSAASRSLPPLAAVVSASISQPPPPSTIPPFSSTSSSTTPTQHVLPLPSSAFARRPHTAGRPGTAPASFFVPSKPAYAGGPGLAHQHSELSLPNYGRSAELAAAAAAVAAAGSYHHHQNNQLLPFGAAAASYETEPASPTAAAYNDSPFSFHPPPPPLSESTPSSNLRKRPFPGLDHDDSPPPSATASRREHPAPIFPGSSASSGGPTATEYDYGSESRPQSRRLTVMELCNDADVHVDGGARPFLPSAGNGGNGNAAVGGGGGASRPNTSSGLCSSASALALVDRSPSTPSTVVGAAAASPASTSPSAAATSAPTIRAGTQTAAVAAVTSSATTAATGGQAPFGFGVFIAGGGSGVGPSGTGGGGVSANVRREFSPSPSPGGPTGLFPATSATSTTSAAAATPSPPPTWSTSPLSRRGDPEYQYGFKPQFREYVGSPQQSYHHHQQFGGGHEPQQREREQHRDRERETRGSPTVANAYSSAAVGMKA